LKSNDSVPGARTKISVNTVRIETEIF